MPDPVRAMIEAAIATGEPATVDAVAGVARATYPDAAAEIDAMLAQSAQPDVALPAQAAPPAERVEAGAPDSPQLADAALAPARRPGFFDNWGGRGEIGGFKAGGNSPATGLTGQLNLRRQGTDWRHNLRLAADYRRSRGRSEREQFSAAYEPQYQIDDGFFAYALAQFERNRFQGFAGRYAVSGGLGYRVLNRGEATLDVKAGPAWRRTELLTGLAENSIAGLIGFDFDWAITDRLKLTQDANAVAEAGGRAVAFIGSNNTTLQLVSGVESKFSERLTGRFSYTIEYDSSPAANAVSTDTQSRFTLVYNF
ncbi:DUF481 domain-containing protein [Alteraurantiacibacter palmitatis]|uniref:YdiY family protein n=1 Tax=Alteraurantiacibacter palmitatis TaxID=2054628 RepID=A0ABV7E8E6_9SPHN